MGRLSLAPASTALHGSAGRGDGAPCPVGPLGILTQRLQTQFLRNHPCLQPLSSQPWSVNTARLGGGGHKAEAMRGDSAQDALTEPTRP